jgi:mannose-1-phosphate guanylyltransferase
MQRALYAVLLAGGSGTRFWPASRQHRPKQFLRIVGERSMLAETCRRLEGLVAPERVLVVTGADQVGEVHAALPELPPANVLAEPEAKNTAPAIALAAFEIRRRDPRSVQIVLPSDHVIRPTAAFQSTLRAAADAASELGGLIVFGVRPSAPATAFGYVEAGAVERVVGGVEVRAVSRFVEKPSEARARELLARGGVYWNSGMFVWTTEAIVAALAEHLPASSALAEPLAPPELARAYAQLPIVSIDFGVLEKARGVRMLAIDYAWSDVGSWDSLAAVIAPDGDGNVASGGGSLATLDAEGCIVHAGPGELTALVGVEGLIVVHAGNVTLVCRRDRGQDVKDLVERLRAQGSEFL